MVVFGSELRKNQEGSKDLQCAFADNVMTPPPTHPNFGLFFYQNDARKVST